ncbi:MAG: hypothetical protein FJ119_06330 [Deltaproteobacteria bacterium]|nr:hypothetical protein [Deltaproteobacteria bacterium]
MSYELLLLLLGAAAIAIVFRATDPFRISAMRRAMRSGGAETLLRSLTGCSKMSIFCSGIIICHYGVM